MVSSSFSQGNSPDVAARKMTVADGYEVKLVVAEPLLRQPVAIDFDNRGRLWAIQYLQYPNPAGLKRVKVDRFSRTVYDRVPDPPPHGPKGADRLTLYEDTDGDGRMDRAKDFVSGLNLASGFAFGHGGVFVLQAPYLLYYPDRDGNDVPDGDPDVLLTGFGMEDAHSVANSLTFGPDGWLYGCQGSTVTASIRGIEFQQGVWRYHPLTHKFELFCEGGGNSWGLDFDATGQLLYSTNVGGHVMLHGVQGGYYWKSFGKHGALHNPFAFGYFDHVPHANFRGGHVTVGGTIQNGKYVAADLLGHAIYWHAIEPNGSTFRTRHGGTLLQANDTWFAPSDLTLGPEGAIYVADWHDKRTAHPDPDAEWDRSNGRVFRIATKGTKPVTLADFAKLSSMELVGLLKNDNDWLVRRARQALADRRDPEVILPLRTLVLETPDDRLALQALWALYVSGGFTDGFATQALQHRVPAVREWAVRLLGDEGRVTLEQFRLCMAMGRTETNPRVCCQLACTAKRLLPATAILIISTLAGRTEIAGDPYLPNLLWWALERHCIEAREITLNLLARPTTSAPSPMLARLLALLARRYASEATELGDAACLRLLQSAPVAAADLYAAVNLGFRDRRAPPALDSALARDLEVRWQRTPDDSSLLEIMMRLGHRTAERRLLDRLDGPPASRRAALAMLAEFGSSACVEPLMRHVDDADAIRALRRFDDTAIATRLLREFGGATRTAAAETLLSRRPWALMMLQTVDAGKIKAAEIPIELIRPLSNLNDAKIDALVRKHWGSLKPATPEEKLAEVRRFNNDLRAGDGDAKRGREIFRKNCANCHQLFGEGEKTGPDLTHANRKDRDHLLVSIVDPSAVVRKEYVAHVVHTTDGRSLSGLIIEQTPGRVTVMNSKSERVSIERSRIESMEESSASLMPEDLLKPLTAQELRDLFKYVQGDRAH